MTAVSQMLLNIKLPDDATFATFVGEPNIATALLQQLRRDDHNLWYIYLWGLEGVGCSHLLQAACHHARSIDLACVYISLAEPESMQPEILQGLENQDLICLDDLDGIIGNSVWEEALFHLFNRASETGSCLLIAGANPPAEMGLGLADLTSRLMSGLVFHLKELNDEQKLSAMRLRAANRGMKLEQDVASFILTRYARGVDQLFDALDKLDEASLHQKRKLTINLAKEVLGL